MLKRFSGFATALAIGTAALVSATPVAAQRYDGGDRSYQYDDRNYDEGYDRGERRHVDDRRGYRDYRNDRRTYRSDRRYRANQKCRDGDGGTIVGAIAGGLLGREVAGRGDRTLGAILGLGVGALAGRSIDRSDRPDYCRR